MLVPLSEANFLLHLPDIYHELAHPLFREKNDPRIGHFINAFFDAIDQVTVFIQDELEKEKKRGGPDPFSEYLNIWLLCWIKGWAEEFFCDLFAVFTVGPAYVWSHLHLSATRGGDPFEVPLQRLTTHPPDGARMQAMLDGLALTGFAAEAADIEIHWNDFTNASQAKAEPEYQRCFPRKITGLLAEKALRGVTDMGCRIAKPETDDYVHRVFNHAWKEFWRDPLSYVDWEKTAVDELKEECRKMT